MTPTDSGKALPPSIVEHDLQEFFGPAAQHRLSVAEKEEIFQSLKAQLPAHRAVFARSFLWSCLAGLFSGWAPIAAVVIVLVLTGAGFTFAETSLPGDFLYPVKRMSEEIGGSLHFSTASRAEANVDHVGRRLDEVDALESKGKLTDKTTEELDQEYRLQRREAIKNISILEDDGKAEIAAAMRARLHAQEDRYEKLFKGKRRQ